MSKYDAALFAAAEAWAVAIDRATTAEQTGDDLSATSDELKTAIVTLYEAVVGRRNSTAAN